MADKDEKNGKFSTTVEFHIDRSMNFDQLQESVFSQVMSNMRRIAAEAADKKAAELPEGEERERCREQLMKEAETKIAELLAENGLADKKD